MEFTAIVRTTHTCRYFKPDPVPAEVLAKVLDAARWGPSGGNRQPVSLILVRETAMKQKLQDLYLPIWDAYVVGIDQGKVRVGGRSQLIADADYFARHLAEIPILVVVCARLADVHPTDVDLERLSIVGGASVYPQIQNMMLAARNIGLGTALTTLLCAVEPQVKPLLGIPDDVSTAAMVPMGWPVKPFPTKLNRRPLEEMVFTESYGNAFAPA